MPVTFESSTVVVALDSAGFSFAHVVSSNADRALYAGIGNSAGPPSSTTACSYNSVALEELWDNTSSAISASSGHLTSAQPASGSHTFSFTLSAAGNDEVGAGVADYSGVHQSTPHGTAVSNSGTGTTITSGAASSAAGEVVVGHGYTPDLVIVPDGAQIQRWESENFSGGGWGAINGSEEAGAASVTLQWTNTTSRAWCAGAVSLKPAGAAAILAGAGFAVTQRMG